MRVPVACSLQPVAFAVAFSASPVTSASCRVVCVKHATTAGPNSSGHDEFHREGAKGRSGNSTGKTGRSFQFRRKRAVSCSICPLERGSNEVAEPIVTRRVAATVIPWANFSLVSPLPSTNSADAFGHRCSPASLVMVYYAWRADGLLLSAGRDVGLSLIHI